MGTESSEISGGSLQSYPDEYHSTYQYDNIRYYQYNDEGDNIKDLYIFTILSFNWYFQSIWDVGAFLINSLESDFYIKINY